ncbi:hypothetical protein [Shinella sp. M31]|uniref:hypothetical protein n=1 Tax=Shinella sp. M31 TaxID=3368615 RepID=UPI003B9F4C71
MPTIEELEREVRARSDEMRKATEALEDAKAAEAAERMEPLKALAERAHSCLCQWNHTDGCSWGYEEGAKDPWACDAHTRWLRHYDKIINGDRYSKPKATLEEVETILHAVEAIKPKVKTAISLLRNGLQP